MKAVGSAASTASSASWPTNRRNSGCIHPYAIHLTIDQQKGNPSITQAFSGGCSCGAVRYESVAEPVVTGHCQCRHCQRASGAGHTSIIGVHKDALTITGEVKYFDYTADSGNIASNGFCPNCGSNVLGKSSGMPDVMAIKVGSLDDPSWFRPGMTIFTTSAQPWDLVDPGLPSFAGMPES